LYKQNRKIEKKIEKKTDTKTGQAFCEGSQLFFYVCLFFFALRNRLPKQKHRQMAKIVKQMK